MVGVEVELHHGCRIVLEKVSERSSLDRNGCNRRNLISVFMSHLDLFGHNLSSCLSACLGLGALRRLENDET